VGRSRRGVVAQVPVPYKMGCLYSSRPSPLIASHLWLERMMQMKVRYLTGYGLHPTRTLRASVVSLPAPASSPLHTYAAHLPSHFGFIVAPLDCGRCSSATGACRLGHRLFSLHPIPHRKRVCFFNPYSEVVCRSSPRPVPLLSPCDNLCVRLR
jgi:hypothetical protein